MSSDDDRAELIECAVVAAGSAAQRAMLPLPEPDRWLEPGRGSGGLRGWVEAGWEVVGSMGWVEEKEE